MKPRDDVHFNKLTQEEQATLMWAWRLGLRIEFSSITSDHWYKAWLSPAACPWHAYRVVSSRTSDAG